MKTSKISHGIYQIEKNGRIFTVSFSECLNEWKIYEGEDWWETVPRLKDAKKWINQQFN